MKQRQLAMVIDLNRCIGCQTCTVACKSMWTDRAGREYMYWNNVETHPGKGYPKKWYKHGGGFDSSGELKEGISPKSKDYGIPWDYNYNEIKESKEFKPLSKVEYGVNWEEDVSYGDNELNSYFFYIPRLCNHCTNPACISACENDAIFKREKDGIVLVDLDKCDGSRFCLSACPYSKIYFNPKLSKSEKCNFCYPLIERGLSPACVEQCVGNARFIGYLDDDGGSVYKLVKEYKVALPLKADFNTSPNIYYIPPYKAPLGFDKNGDISENSQRLPMDYLEFMFGESVYDAIDLINQEIERKNSSELIAILSGEYS